MEQLEKDMREEEVIVQRGNGAAAANPKLKLIEQCVTTIARLSESLDLTRARRKGLARAPGQIPVNASTQELDSDLDGGEPEDEFKGTLAPPVH